MQLFTSTSRPLALILTGVFLFSSGVALDAAPGVVPDAQGQKVTRRLEQMLRTTIKSQNGSPIAIQLSPTLKAAQGFFSDIRISGGAVKLKSLYVSQFQLRSQNVIVDVPALWHLGKVRTRRAQTSLRVVITENDLTRMLAESKNTKDMNLKVKYVGNKMRITGVLNYTFLNGPVSGLAQLRQTAEHNVYLDILSLQLRGVEVPGFLKNQLSNRINPVINYANVPFNPPFRTLRVVGNKAILTT